MPMVQRVQDLTYVLLKSGPLGRVKALILLNVLGGNGKVVKVTSAIVAGILLWLYF